jgi:hypothetical protein
MESIQYRHRITNPEVDDNMALPEGWPARNGT